MVRRKGRVSQEEIERELEGSSDIRGYKGLQPDVITGGFPCQDASVANTSGKGIEGERTGLWREYAQTIRLLRPRYAIIENVPNLINRGFEQVLKDLAEARYNAFWFTLRAAEVGLPHRRERLFIIAYDNEIRASWVYEKFTEDFVIIVKEISERTLEGWDDELFKSTLLGTGNGFPKRKNYIEVLGNAVVPQCAEAIGRFIMQLEKQRQGGGGAHSSHE